MLADISKEMIRPLAHYEFEIPFWIYCSPKYIRNHRDIVKELADECHKQGIALHLYYSHIDWYREDAIC